MKITKVILVALICLLSAACEPSQPDQCLRAKLFRDCMELLPAGPNEVKYNDWSEVVAECGSQAYYQSIRSQGQIKAECR